MAGAIPRKDTSTDDTDDRNQRVVRVAFYGGRESFYFPLEVKNVPFWLPAILKYPMFVSSLWQVRGGQLAVHTASDSSDRSEEKIVNQKNLRRLAQNREAARKSRLRKKLESSRLKLTQLEQEQEQQRARQLGIFISSSGDEYITMEEMVHWLRSAVNYHVGYTELQIFVDNVGTHFDEIYKLNGNAAKADVFHILSGMWTTPAERCFMWIGGFHSSELLKVHSLRLQTMHQMYRILMTRQSARALLVIYDYCSRLRALSSLRLAWPRE